MRSARYALCLALTLGTIAMGSVSVPSLHAQTADRLDTPDTGVPMTIEGLARDVACPMQNHQSTAKQFNLECALACARAGSPLVILTESGAMYFPIREGMPDGSSAREKLMPYVGKYVRVSGTVFRRNGTRAIIIKSISEMKGVKLNTTLGGD